VSIGVGRTKQIAKLASRRAKPNRIVVIDPLTRRTGRTHPTPRHTADPHTLAGAVLALGAELGDPATRWPAA